MDVDHRTVEILRKIRSDKRLWHTGYKCAVPVKHVFFSVHQSTQASLSNFSYIYQQQKIPSVVRTYFMNSLAFIVQAPIRAIIYRLKSFLIGITKTASVSPSELYRSHHQNLYSKYRSGLESVKRPTTRYRCGTDMYLQIGQSHLTSAQSTMTVTNLPAKTISSAVDLLGIPKCCVSNSRTSDWINAFVYPKSYSKPTFCYFMIDLRDEGTIHTDNAKKERCSTSGNILSQFLSRRYEEDEDHNNNYSSSNNLSSQQLFEEPCAALANLLVQSQMFPLTLSLSRHRNFSNSSDESFICFQENDEDDLSQRWIEGVYNDELARNLNDSDSESEHINMLEYTDSMMPIQRKVRFNPKPRVYVMHAWSFAYRSARKGPWEVYALDRSRFQQRIRNAATHLDPILSFNHRNSIYNSRFADL